MSSLFRCRPGGFWGTKSILQMLDEADGATWRDVTFAPTIGLFTAVKVRYWQAIEEKIARQADLARKRQEQRDAKKAIDFKASQFSDTRMPPS